MPSSPSKLSPLLITGLILGLALLGFADALFIFIEKTLGGPIPCLIGTGCDTVTNSPYSKLFGIPLAVHGMVYYLIVGVITLLYLDTKKKIFARLIFPITGIGFLMSLYFIYIQKFLIGAFCTYCVISIIITILLFALGIAIRRVLQQSTPSTHLPQ